MHTAHFDADEVAEAAMRIFWSKGYAATSIQDLIEVTGLSRSSLYNSFDSKHGIFQFALRRYHDQTASLVSLLAKDGPALERVRELLRGIVKDELRDLSCSGCLVANTALEMGGRDEVVTALLGEHFSVLEAALTSLMQRGQQQGDIDSSKSPVALARFIVATIQGLRVIARGNADAHQARRLQDVVEVALAAL
jgi:TetR/AcrR family transcriptional regulator, transcriptional repressor for nem operon